MVKLSVDKVLLKARAHLKRGETLAAENLYKNILNAFPTNKKAKHGLANIKKSLRAQSTLKAPQEIIESLVKLYNNGQLELVIEKAQEITNKYPETFMAWNILGVAAARAKKLDQAVYSFLKVTLIKPDYPDGFYNMGNALKDQGKLEEAVESYKKAISCKSNYPEAFYNMGMAYKNQDKTENAIQAFQRAIKLKPDYV